MKPRLDAAFTRFVDVSDMSDTQVAAASREIGIDIAVDLKGHVFDSRPGIFAHHAAPVQVNYLGYPGTMGMESIQYLLADKIVIPPEHRPFYTEKIVYLPDTYQVNDSTKVSSDRVFTRAELELPENAFVFCCFNHIYKLTPAVFDVWMRLLHKVPGSVLWLLQDGGPGIANLRKEAEKRGVAGERIVFAKRLGPGDHLARHRNADLFVDTFCYNAHTTATDALRGGLPIVTMLGATFAARVAASLLTAIGLTDLIAHSPEEYEEMALALARNPAKLGAIRRRLAENKATYPLLDTARFTRNIEAAYLRMMEIHERGGPPEHFSVAPQG
jgi:predicted O-linked N-acetylglucosamine transferase (SPINDLY family)